MAVFSTNQVRQLYVAKAVKTTVTSADTAGTIALKKDVGNKHLYFQYKGADNLMRSDLIPIEGILYAKGTDGATMAHKVKKVEVKLDTNYLSNGNPLVGQDYLLRIVINQFVGMSDMEPYIKYGIVHVAKGDTPSTFYKKMAISLAKNFSRELEPMLKFYVLAEEAATEVTAATKEASLTGTYTSIVIEEVEQEWRRGLKEQSFVDFVAIPHTVTSDGEEITWGTATEMTSTSTINNGKKVADLEYFCMGERGDIYRGVGWPNNIDTEYLVDPTKEYHVLDIHYAFTGQNEGPQKSEKSITIVSDDKSKIDSLIGTLNTLAGLSVAKITAVKGSD